MARTYLAPFVAPSQALEPFIHGTRVSIIARGWEQSEDVGIPYAYSILVDAAAVGGGRPIPGPKEDFPCVSAILPWSWPRPLSPRRAARLAFAERPGGLSRRPSWSFPPIRFAVGSNQPRPRMLLRRSHLWPRASKALLRGRFAPRDSA